ncbi:substrate-binding periplasmic protein [Chitinimonas koreensis]|uniref:substrate-binding periplasmic protein n=1 Tax=Chitinimonas koreensis TaxID=356302 RepID=UPI00040F2D0C|nr:hypothetical protein [Chitinimonas koreensis]QNM95888.1 hypothetical protein H9L41_18960 [Chitinimonas koreensis]
MRFLPLLALGLAALAAPASAADAPLRLCTLDRPFYPYTMPDGSGRLQYLAQLGARQLQLPLTNYTAPRKRCLDDLQRGNAEAVFGAFSAERLPYAVYPMRGDQADESYALATARFMVYRRAGSRVEWDGSRFSGLDGRPLGVQLGFIHSAKVQALGVPYDDGARTARQNFDKLRLDRVAAVLAAEEEARGLTAPGEFEALPVPFDRTVLYLIVARSYYQQDPRRIDKLWRTLRELRESPEYKQYLSQYRPQD